MSVPWNNARQERYIFSRSRSDAHEWVGCSAIRSLVYFRLHSLVLRLADNLFLVITCNRSFAKGYCFERAEVARDSDKVLGKSWPRPVLKHLSFAVSVFCRRARQYRIPWSFVYFCHSRKNYFFAYTSNRCYNDSTLFNCLRGKTHRKI